MTEPGDFNSKIIAEFRENGGKVGGAFGGGDMLLLHHTGARTGTQRITPSPTSGWGIYDRQKERAPRFAEYEKTAAEHRKIPVVVLDPVK